MASDNNSMAKMKLIQLLARQSESEDGHYSLPKIIEFPINLNLEAFSTSLPKSIIFLPIAGTNVWAE
jgi:hypothetical protein